MFKSFELKLSLSYIFNKGFSNKKKFIAFQIVASTFGITIGVCTLITVMSLLDGYMQSITKVVLGLYPHIQIISSNKIEGLNENEIDRIRYECNKLSDIILVQPLFEKKIYATIKRKDDNYNRVLNGEFFFRGIYASKKFETVSDIKTNIINGRDNFSTIFISNSIDYNILVDENVARYFNLMLGDIVYIENENFKSKTKFIVSGIFNLGISQSSDNCFFIYTGANNFKKLFPNIKKPFKMGIKTTNSFKSIDISNILQEKISNSFIVIDWITKSGKLFDIIKALKYLIFVILSSIIILGSYFVVITLYIIMDQKKKDIAILRSLGAGDNSLIAIFLSISFIISIIGIFFGILFGICCSEIVCFQLSNYLHQITGVESLKPAFKIGTTLMIIFSTLSIVLISSLIPVRIALSIKPNKLLN